MSPETHLSLIAGLQTPHDGAAWERFARLYEQPIRRWSLLACRGWCVANGEAEQLAEEMAAEIVGEIREHIRRYRLEMRRHEGGFRAWLRGLTRNLTLGRLRAHVRNPLRGGGDSAVRERLENEPDPDTLDRECDAVLESELRREAIALVLGRASPRTQRIFRELLGEDRPSTDAVRRLAQALEISVANLYQQKSRLLVAIRDEFERLRGELEVI